MGLYGRSMYGVKARLVPNGKRALVVYRDNQVRLFERSAGAFSYEQVDAAASGTAQ